MRKVDKIATLAVVSVPMGPRVWPTPGGPYDRIGIGELPGEVIVESATTSSDRVV